MDPDPASTQSMIIWPFVLAFVLLVLIRAYFSSAESAFSAMNRIRIKSEADAGKRRAKAALYISNNFDRAIVTLLIGNNLASVAGSAIATLLFSRLLEAGYFGTLSEEVVTVLCTLFSTLAFFLFSEMIPKALANDRSETLSRAFAPGLRVIMKVMKPVAVVLNAFVHRMTKLFKTEEEPTITEEELYDIADTAEEEGVLNEEESDLFKSALEFGETEVSEIMTMRPDIIFVDIRMSSEEVLKVIESTTVSRIPVCDGSLDRIVGVLPVRSFMRQYLKNENVSLKKQLLFPFYVRDIAFIHDCMEIMREQRFSMAIVLDENDRTVGLITIEDLLEELVGEIFDESDIVDQNFVKLGGNYFEVNPDRTGGEALAKMKIRCRDYQLVSKKIRDWVEESLDHNIEEEDSFTYRNLEITVSEMDEGRIEKVTFHIVPPVSSPKGGEAS